MNLRDGQMTKSVATSPARQMRFVADHAGHVRFAFGDDVDGNAKIYLRTPDADRWKELGQAEAEHCYPMSFDKDEWLAYFDCSGGRVGTQLRSWNPAIGAWNVLWSNPKIDLDGLVFGPVKDDVIGVGFIGEHRPGCPRRSHCHIERWRLYTIACERPRNAPGIQGRNR